MPFKLSDLVFTDEKPTQLWFDQDGGHPVRAGMNGKTPKDVLSVSYRPRFYTRTYEAESARAREQDGPGSSTIVQFLRIVTKWDLIDEKGKAVPLTVEALEPLPTRLLNDIIGGCIEDMQPDPTKSAS